MSADSVPKSEEQVLKPKKSLVRRCVKGAKRFLKGGKASRDKHVGGALSVAPPMAMAVAVEC